MAPECCGCARCHQWCVGPNMGYSVLCDGGMDPSTRFSGSGFSNIGRTEPNHVASRDGTSIARPHCSIGFCHSTCNSRTPAYQDTEWQAPSDLRGHYPAAAGRLQCAHGGRSRPPRGNSPNLCVVAEMSVVGGERPFASSATASDFDLTPQFHNPTGRQAEILGS